jgi:hypothetical protein
MEHISDHQAFVCECGSVNFNLLRSLSIECSGCGKQFGLWREMDSELLFAALLEIAARIEACGASPELTNAIVITSDTRHAIGNKYNAPDSFAVERVKQGIPR